MLRKDFPLAPWEIYESRAAGADAVLLIAAVLDPPRLEQMLEVARELGMTALVEVHERAACPAPGIWTGWAKWTPSWWARRW